MLCSISYERLANGVSYQPIFLIGKPFTTTASAARFDRWETNGLLEQINRALNQLDRQQEGRAAYPSIFSIVSQSVKLTPMLYEHRGWDGHKNVNGRKRQLVVDSGGRLWVAKVHAANQADGTASLRPDTRSTMAPASMRHRSL